MEYISNTGSADINKKFYISVIEEQREKVKKNFQDMDLENATVRDEIEKEANEIVKECNQLISKLQSI